MFTWGLCLCVFQAGVSPLHFAAQTGDSEVVSLLLQGGANPLLQTKVRVDVSVLLPTHFEALCFVWRIHYTLSIGLIYMQVAPVSCLVSLA